MTKSRRTAACLLLCALGCFSEDAPAGQRSGTSRSDDETVAWPAEVTDALAALEAPSPPRVHINEPPFQTKTYQPDDYYEDCAEAIDLLSKTPFNVDSALTSLSQPDNPLPVRFRAVLILTRRKDPAVVPVLGRMCSANDAAERFVAWRAYRDAVEHKQLPPPADCGAVLAAYENEKDGEIHEQIADFLGTVRSRDAVPLLIATLQANPGDCPVIFALGRIGDPQAVPAVIAAFEKERLNRHVHCAALGMLATPAAVDFLIGHLDEYGAATALADAKNPRALPALQRHLDKLTQATPPDELEIALTRVAAIQLGEHDPAPHLLALAEERSNNEWLRHHALMTLKGYDAGALHARLLRLFRDDPDLDVKRFCVDLLEDSALEGVTEALVNRVRVSEPSGDYREQGLQDALLAALNKRLGYSCKNLEAMRHKLQSRSRNSISE